MTAPAPLTEDDIYRASTQYRFWSFTADSLAEERAKINAKASDEVREALHRVSGSDKNAESSNNVECLSPDEELKLVRFYCDRLMKLADFYEFPTSIKATAVQYLKRFYLTNSPMDYHPKQMVACALFFATKTDNNYISIDSFVSKLPKATKDSVTGPEYLLTQGLKFNFDVKHPHRALEGGFMELHGMSTGGYLGPSSSADKAKEVQQRMMSTDPVSKEKAFEKSIDGVQKRIQYAHSKAIALLKTTAILSDAYFLYTPAQMWLGAFMAVDEPLCTFYVQTILGSQSDIEDQLIETLHGCAALLMEKQSDKTDEEEKQELKQIDKKLYKCSNPEKINFASSNPSEKRVNDKGAENDEKVLKKRKLEKEQKTDDIFGPAITK